ncbi:MAG: SRPBCC family protein [Pseudomonadota bacterium]
MLRFEIVIDIERPVADVFAFVSDFTHLPLWNYYIRETTPEDAGPLRVGRRYRQTRKTDTQKFEVIEYIPDQTVAIRLLKPTPPAIIRYTFQETSEGTRLTDEWSLKTIVPLPGFVTRFATRSTKAAVAQNLAKLKTLLETGSVTLQDGRRTQF